MGAFRVFRFTCSLKCMTPAWILMVLSRVLTDMGRMMRNWNCLMHTFSVEVAQGDTLPSCFSSQPVNKCFSWALLCHLFLHILFVLFLAVLQNGPHVWCYRAVWCPERRRLWSALWRKHVLDKLWSGMSYSTIGREFNVNESTVILNKVSLNRNAFWEKKKNKTEMHFEKRWYVDQLMKMWPEAHETYPSISLWHKGLAFANSVFELISWNMNTVGHENRL